MIHSPCAAMSALIAAPVAPTVDRANRHSITAHQREFHRLVHACEAGRSPPGRANSLVKCWKHS